MKTEKQFPRARLGRFSIAFTIVELLIVIAIIGILAAMLLPVLSIAQKHAQRTQAHLEEGNLVTAITQYESDYSRMPVSSAIQSSGLQSYTYGGVFSSPENPAYSVGATNPATSMISSNNEVIAILIDATNYLNGWENNGPTINTNYQKNPKQNVYLANPKYSGWDPNKGSKATPGIGNDLVYRDPWGNPYVITVDLNEDSLAEDTFYGMPSVSSSTAVAGGSGLDGLTYQPAAGGGAGVYAFHGNVMVWSAGPDGQIDPTNAPNLGANKDNVVSWQ